MTPVTETVLTEFAPAKINLTLEVLGRRADGYHELSSLVAFADVGDTVSLDTTAPSGIHVTGPFAGALGSDNILARTLAALSDAAPQLTLGAVTLEKRLPVAAGIGGGSADAAALLRALTRANLPEAESIDWATIAAGLGADVPVCLVGKPAWMTGRGETVTPLTAPLLELHALLVNPMAPVPSDKTARVFRTLAAPPLRVTGTRNRPPSFASTRALLDHLQAHGNDLTDAAIAVVPEIRTVLSTLAARPEVILARLSGAGPTCVALCADADRVQACAHAIAAGHPTWWLAVTRLGASSQPSARD